jgi:hypothetical protein
LGSDKIYDGGVSANVSLNSNGVLAGDTLVFSNASAAFADKNVGVGKTITVNGISVSGMDAGNYSINNSTTTFADITPLAITVNALGNSKVYDGNTLAQVDLSSGGILMGDVVNFSNATANFANKNVGIEKLVTVTGISASGTDAGNYSINTSATTMADITPRSITVNALANDKVYDSNTNAVVTLSSGGILEGDLVNFASSSANFSDKNVGSDKTVSVEGITASGLDALNYSINESVSTFADITPRLITINALGSDKVYDANTSAQVSLSTNGVLAGDQVSLANSSANFSDKNVGTAKTITVNGISASGLDAGNYSVNNTATTFASITPLAITVNALGADKVYDRTTAATVSLSSSGVLAGDSLSFSNAAANFSDKNVGLDKLVTVTGISASGMDAGNYSINDVVTTTADITPLGIFVIAKGTDKVADGTTADVVFLSSDGILGGDVIDFNYGAANFATANPVVNGVVTVTGINAFGTDAGNYVILNPVTTTTASITQNIPPRLDSIIAELQDRDLRLIERYRVIHYRLGDKLDIFDVNGRVRMPSNVLGGNRDLDMRILMGGVPLPQASQNDDDEDRNN